MLESFIFLQAHIWSTKNLVLFASAGQRFLSWWDAGKWNLRNSRQELKPDNWQSWNTSNPAFVSESQYLQGQIVKIQNGNIRGCQYLGPMVWLGLYLLHYTYIFSPQSRRLLPCVLSFQSWDHQVRGEQRTCLTFTSKRARSPAGPTTIGPPVCRQKHRRLLGLLRMDSLKGAK